jgi:hypothetical protein
MMMNGKSRVRSRAYNDLRSKTVVQVTDTDIDSLKRDLYAQGGRNESEYLALEKIEHLSGQSSASGFLLGTLTAIDGSIALDNTTNILTTPALPRANYKIEKIGLIGSSLDITGTFKIVLFSELQSAEVPLYSEVFTPVAASDAWSFSPAVTIPENTVVDVRIVCDKTHTPSLSIGILYGRVR